MKATVIVTTQPVCQFWSKLSFWPPEGASKVSEGVEKTERQQFSPLADTSAELWPNIQVTLLWDW